MVPPTELQGTERPVALETVCVCVSARVLTSTRSPACIVI